MHAVESVRFPGHDGVMLAGLLHLPASARGVVVLSHCFTCSKQQLTTARLAKALAGAGYAVLRFDHAGLGQSAGEFERTSITTLAGDVAGAADLVAARSSGPLALVGHSLGGLAVLHAARRLPGVEAVAVVAAPSVAQLLTRLLPPGAMAALRGGDTVPIVVDGRRFVLGPAFLEGLDGDVVASAALGRPLLVVQAGRDQLVAEAEGRALYDAADEPRVLRVVPEADHLFSRRTHSAQLAEVVATWLDHTIAEKRQIKKGGVRPGDPFIQGRRG